MVLVLLPSACKGGLTRACSARLGSVQRTPHELSSVSHHRLRFTRGAGGDEANLAAGEAAGWCVRPTGEQSYPRIRWLGMHNWH